MESIDTRKKIEVCFSPFLFPLFKDEFEIMYEKQLSYPIILKEEKKLEEFISTEQLESLEDENHLISLLKERIMNQ